jgi:2-oxoglutarate ferredoxin oxidoreductase subunit beta
MDSQERHAATLTENDFANGNRPTWCPGCGDFAVLKAIQRALAILGRRPENTVLVSGIGCSGKISHYFGGYAIHTPHGRALPVAQGIALARPDLTVIAAGGDGDGYGIGVGHLVHAARRNVPLLYLVMDNGVYGNTKGQTSPTSPQGFRSSTTPYGSPDDPIHPLALAWASGISWIGQGFSGDVQRLTALVTAGIEHPGFALLNVLSPCVVFNRTYGYEYYRERIRSVATPASSTVDLIRLLETTEYPVGVLATRERLPRPGVSAPLDAPREVNAVDLLRRWHAL